MGERTSEEMTAAGVRDDAHFELSFSPCIRVVSVVRRFVSEFYSEILADADMTSRLALATHELLENSARYALDDQTHLRIAVTREVASTSITITTTNRAAESHLASLRARLDELIAAPDPQAHYLTLMQRTAKRTDGSGLGLGRVRAESEMEISYEIEGDKVVLHATARLAAKTS